MTDWSKFFGSNLRDDAGSGGADDCGCCHTSVRGRRCGPGSCAGSGSLAASPRCRGHRDKMTSGSEAGERRRAGPGRRGWRSSDSGRGRGGSEAESPQGPGPGPHPAAA